MIKTGVEYDETRKTLELVTEALGRNDLSPAERNELQLVSYHLSGRLLSIWIPFDWKRRTTMAFLFAVGVYGLLSGRYYLIIAWAVAAIFSPRIVGEISFLLGKASRKHT